MMVKERCLRLLVLIRVMHAADNDIGYIGVAKALGLKEAVSAGVDHLVVRTATEHTVAMVFVENREDL